MSFTALLAAYMLKLGRRWKQFLWAWLALTFVATVYLGWHYVVDDVAGLADRRGGAGAGAGDHRVRPAPGGSASGGSSRRSESRFS